jgi:hypothetical protein
MPPQQRSMNSRHSVGEANVASNRFFTCIWARLVPSWVTAHGSCEFLPPLDMYFC